MDRDQFRGAVIPLQYRIQSEFDRDDSQFSKGICIVRFQSVKPGEINDAVIELFHLAKVHNGDYDGWETQVISD